MKKDYTLKNFIDDLKVIVQYGDRGLGKIIEESNDYEYVAGIKSHTIKPVISKGYLTVRSMGKTFNITVEESL